MDIVPLRGTEDMLLWRHRVENRCPIEANYGRMSAVRQRYQPLA
jgi:hypothetical protein